MSGNAVDLTWLATSLGLIPPLGWAVIASGRGAVGGRLIAVQLTSSLGVLLLIAMSFVIAQPASIDLALTLALLALPGVLVLTFFYERWL
ncbi:MAG: hypothetical protein ACREU2_05550 [Steroidobacteraceae bacterium]